MIRDHPLNSVAIIGGGVTGLAAAWRLANAGFSVRVFEAGSMPGGLIRTERAGNWLVEQGPNAIQESPEIRTLVSDLKLTPEQIEAGPLARNRFIVRAGRLVAAPLSPIGLLSSGLYSFQAKLQICSDLFWLKKKRSEDLSVGRFFRQHFGYEAFVYGAQPLIGGIYAGDTEKLSARHCFPKLWAMEAAQGSLIRGLMSASRRRPKGEPRIPRLISFKNGLQTLTDTMKARLPEGSVIVNAAVHAIRPGSGWRWRLEWRDRDGPQSEESDFILAALPAHALAKIAIGEDGKRPLESLGTIEHPAVASIFIGYKKEQVSHPLIGFGALVPSRERRSLLGAVFSSSLFPGRAPDGHVAVTALLGGSLRPGLAIRPPEDLVAVAREELRHLLGAEGEPAFIRATLCPKAIPQYELGYERHLEAISAVERWNPGLLIGGSVKDGISVPDCVRSGISLAERVIASRG